MVIKFKNGFLVESHKHGWKLKLDTGKVKKAKNKENTYVPVIRVLAHSSKIEGIIEACVRHKIRRIDVDKLRAIYIDIKQIKKEVLKTLEELK